MRAVTVAAFNSQAEAEPLKTRLVAAGISAEVHSESRLDEELDFSRVSAGVRIEVPRSDFEAALDIVYAWNVTETAETAETAQFRQLESDLRGTISRGAGSSPPPPA